jgi:hypothetical protein
MRHLWLPVLWLVASCGGGAPSQMVRSPGDDLFDEASRTYQVPVGVLKAVAWVETRAVMTPGVPSSNGSWGWLQLSEAHLNEAARVTGVSIGELKVDARANLLGAAAVLRATFDLLQHSDPSLDGREAGDWYQAVALYPGFEGALEAHDYATQVYLALERGFAHPERLTQAPLSTRWRRHAPAVASRHDGLDYSGAAAFVQSPNYTAGRSTYEFVVVHTMQGSYAGSRSWFLNPAANASSHYLVRSSDGQITQMVAHADTAWHVQCYNRRSIGLEHEGYVADPGTWYTDAMYAESAKLTAYIADRHGITKDRAHIIGHNEVPSSCNTNGHTDPGAGWNWTKYMQLVTSGGASTGLLLGAIYTGGDLTNRVQGATVTVNGQSTTTAADGLYQFTLAPGTYTAVVTKNGFTPAQVTRTVTAAAQSWASMELLPVAPSPGVLAGTVSAGGQPLAGATVTVNGLAQTSSASGAFSFSLAPGSYVVTATKAGFAQGRASATVLGGQTTSVGLVLVATVGPDLVAPVVMVSSPTANASLDLAIIEVRGTATDDRGPVSAIAWSLNGGAAVSVPVANGLFTALLQLSPGRNTLEVKARDDAGNEGVARVLATFNAGVHGVVYQALDTSKLVADATVELRDSRSGALLATTTTGANGTFFAGVPRAPLDCVLVVRAPGYVTLSETVTVPDDRQAQVSLALRPGQDEPSELRVSFVEPTDGATVYTDTVVVYGAVQGFDLAGAVVNGIEAELLPGGGFRATVPLVDGANTIEALASGLRAEVVSARLRLTRKRANEPVVGGCAVSSVLGLPLVVLTLARRRRRG